MSVRAVAHAVVGLLVVGLFSAPIGVAQAAEWQVDMIEHLYDPAELNITVGDTVTWNNIEPHDDDHTVTSHPIEDPNGPLDSGIIASRETFSYTFDAAGDFPYFCEVHGFDMSGIVRVRDQGQPFAVDDDLIVTKSGSGEASGVVHVSANDSDPDGDALTLTGHDEISARGGTVSCGADGACTYAAPSDAGCGSRDSFSYTISDGTQTDSAEVTVVLRCRTGGPSATRVDLTLRRHLIARGAVASTSACEGGRRVKIQRRTPEGWRGVASTRTRSDGTYSLGLPDRPGRYRARAISTASCEGAVSLVGRHRH